MISKNTLTFRAHFKKTWMNFWLIFGWQHTTSNVAKNAGKSCPNLHQQNDFGRVDRLRHRSNCLYLCVFTFAPVFSGSLSTRSVYPNNGTRFAYNFFFSLFFSSLNYVKRWKNFTNLKNRNQINIRFFLVLLKECAQSNVNNCLHSPNKSKLIYIETEKEIVRKQLRKSGMYLSWMCGFRSGCGCGRRVNYVSLSLVEISLMNDVSSSFLKQTHIGCAISRGKF